MIELDIMRLIQAEATNDGHRLFRNNVAKAWVGIYAGRTADGTVTLKNARPLHAGLCVGSSDLIGFTATGRFLAVECKSAIGRPSPEQINFIATARRFGCLAGLAKSIADYKGIVNDNSRD